MKSKGQKRPEPPESHRSESARGSWSRSNSSPSSTPALLWYMRGGGETHFPVGFGKIDLLIISSPTAAPQSGATPPLNGPKRQQISPNLSAELNTARGEKRADFRVSFPSASGTALSRPPAHHSRHAATTNPLLFTTKTKDWTHTAAKFPGRRRSCLSSS